MNYVWYHSPTGGRRRKVLKREHVCTKKCLRVTRMFGLSFPYCLRYSYREKGE